MLDLPPLDPAVLPARIRTRFIDRINGLRVRVPVPANGPPAGRGIVRHGETEQRDGPQIDRHVRC
jgi:hypothetical protein